MLSERPVRLDPAADYDVIGRKVPQRLGFMAFARGIPGYAARFDREVPGEFLALVNDGVLEVACPCGQTPRLTRMAPVVCACGRTFAHVGSKVVAARAA